MLTRVDRLQLAVPDIPAAEGRWTSLLGARHEFDDRVEVLGARRSSYRLGSGWVEFLQPDGAGPLGEAVAARGPHLFAGGVATADVGALAERLRQRGLEPAAEGGQLHLFGCGIRLVVSPDEPLEKVGLIDTLYEITDLRADAAAWTNRYADLFGLDTQAFVPIDSSHYGYSGALTLFDDARLHRLEVITPTDQGRTMGRFFAKQGEVLYMCYAETADLTEIHGRAAESGAPVTANLPDGMFLHPQALGGMMLGLSRRTYAWTWSGHPDRVEPA